MDKEKVRKYIWKTREAMKNIEFNKKNEDVNRILNLSKAYLDDAEFFLNKGMVLEAAEAMGIAWAYLDALLNLNIIKIKGFEELFTIEKEK